MRKYTTSQGDMWDSIALRLYGNERFMHELVGANPGYRSVAVFPANLVLNVPDISTEEKVTFPPWRRGKAAGGV